MYLYDFDFNLKISISTQIKIQQIVADSKDHSKYVFMKSDKSPSIHVFNSNLFSFVGIINFNKYYRNILMVYDETILLQNYSDGNISVYKIDLMKTIHENFIKSKFVCHINPLKPHLFRNPYLLPCVQSACLDCIHSYYNLYTRKFQCNFGMCQAEHVLSDKLIKHDHKLSESIKDNTRDLIKSMINYGNNIERREGLNIYFQSG